MSGIGVETNDDVSNANGITTVFTYTFFAYDASQVKVYSVLNNARTPITSGITITPNSNYIGGSVTFDVAPDAAVGKILRIREVPYTQTTEFTDIIRYKETALERALNTLEMQIQQVNSKANKSLRYADDVTVTDATIGQPVDGQLLSFSGTTGKIVGTVLGSISNLSTVFTSLTSGDFLNYNGTNWINRKHLGAKGTSIASAATTDIGAADSDFIDLTGTATITSLGATTTRNHVWVNCTGAMTFTHNGTSLIMPGAANRTAAVGDKYEFVRISGSNWACVGYALASGQALVVSQNLVLGTPVATTSGTAIDFTGITAGVKQIIISMDGVSNTAGDNFLIQLGDSGGVETTSYDNNSNVLTSGVVGNNFNTSDAICRIDRNGTAVTGNIVISLIDNATNTWSASCVFKGGGTRLSISSGSKSLSGTLDRIRLTTVGGTGTFNAGKMNIQYQ